MVELVVAMVIIALVLMLLIGIQISALTSVTESRERQQATAFANEAIEQMRALPWNTLNRGLYTGFHSASGFDPLVTGGQLSVDGRTVNLINDATDLSEPVIPLYVDGASRFGSAGSHIQIRRDPSLAGVDFYVKSYVFAEGSAVGGESPAVGLAVVVEWFDRSGNDARTVLWSTAYRGGGCGDLSTQPFLGACQAFLESSATSGTVVTSVSAATIAELGVDAVPIPLTPDSGVDQYSISMRSAGVAATSTSQQATLVRGVLQYGGTTGVTNDPDAAPSEYGYALYELLATDNTAVAGDVPTNPADLVDSQGVTSEATRTVGHVGDHVRFRAQSDYRRGGVVDASSQESCMSGITAGTSCAIATMTNLANDTTGSGYIVVDIGPGNSPQVLRLSRRLAESGGNSDTAWAARFTDHAGTASTGCQTVGGAGCAAAGASRTMADLHIGTLLGSATWNGEAASGIARLEGRTGCSFYRDSVLVQRGAAQTDTVPTIDRCGQIRYWTGLGATGYSTLAVNASTDTIVYTAPVQWTNGTVTITATGQIQVSPGRHDAVGADATCNTEACAVTATAGNILFVVAYEVEWSSHHYVVTSVTTVNGASGAALYKAAPTPGGA